MRSLGRSCRSFRRWVRYSVISSQEEAMMWGGLVFVLTVSVACIAARKPRQGCQAMRVDMCRDAGYRRTKFPNRLGHRKQDFAEDAARQFDVIINSGCSAHFKRLVCMLYAPPCDNVEDDTGLPVFPCRSLCKAAREDCLSWLEENGLRWPRVFNCSQFPDHREEKCNGKVERTSTRAFTGKCESITIPLCADLSYTSAGFPNHLGHTRQEAAGLEAHLFFPLVKVQCSPHLKEFVCSMYAPPCGTQRNTPLLRPCRSLCEAAKSGCEDLMSKFAFKWPESLECDLLPTRDEEDCFGYLPPPPPPTDAAVEERCEDLTMIAYCQDVEYSKAVFPNRLNHPSQLEASLEIERFLSELETDCSPYLKQFLCHMYAPPCGNHEIPQLPCRSLCQAVRTECASSVSRWPESLDCDSLPVGDEAPCSGRIEPTEAPPSVSPSQLLGSLLEDYDKRSRPDVGQTTVQIGLTLRRVLGLDNESGLLTLHTWINMEWRDERLFYGNLGVRRIELDVRYLWMPDIYLISGVKADEMPLPLTTEASIHSDGTVRYVVPWTFTVPCGKRRDAGWDCQVVFQSWNKPADEIALSPLEQFLDAEEYNSDMKWTVRSVSADRLITNVRDEPDKSRLIFTLVVVTNV